MLQSLYSALAGMRAQQTRIDVVGNNIANINTTAFKAGRADFADTLYALMKPHREASGVLQNGSGTVVAAVQHIQQQGNNLMTANPLDFMVDGGGYFTLAGPDGQMSFTRDGSFKAASINGSNYLVTADGYFVLGANSQPIQIPGDASAVTADTAGNLLMGGTVFATLQMAAFPNPEGLLDAGGNRYLASDASGEPQAAVGAVVRQGWLEGSNVDMAGEMARLIQAQRAYSVMGTAIRTTDEMETTANRLAE